MNISINHSEHLTAVPLTPRQADIMVGLLHRHHGPVPRTYAQICIGAVKDGRLVGVSICGRPTNRNSDDGQTIEVLRLATDGTHNAPSFLLGASRAAAKAIGAWRIITYTLDDEGGASLRAAGWTLEQQGIQSNWARYKTAGRSVKEREHYDQTKSRWVCYFTDGPIPFTAPDALDPSEQTALALDG